MSNSAPAVIVARIRDRPLGGLALASAVLAVWVAGALYCSGYERLLTGLDNWPGSLGWSAAAVLPWLMLFEWSKSRAGRLWTATGPALLASILSTAAVSLLLEVAANLLEGSPQPPIALALLRRLPAIGGALLLILWSRAAEPAARTVQPNDQGLKALAWSIDWVESADNYVELHVKGRTVVRRMTMQDAQTILEPLGFARVHRRFLVNRRQITEIIGSNGARLVCMADGTELPVGRSFAGALLLSS